MMKRAFAVLLVLSAGCVNPLNPEAGMALPKDPGGLVVQVRDQANLPIQGVWVYVEMPNQVGSTFQEGTPTRADGSATFYAVPAGTRRVDVTLPAGFVAGADGVSRQVVIVKGQTVTVAFVLTRS